MIAERQDHELLREFVRSGDQSAFACVLRRHVDMVFGTALRKVGDAGAAQEVAQDVFAALARNAWQFGAGDSVAAWLHRATFLKTKTWWRGELRRRRREHAAVEMGTIMNVSEGESSVRPLVPVLDEGLLSLREKDRAALLLRFYENQPFRKVGAAMGVSDDAAQKRVASALENLARFFRRRGYKTATAAASAAVLEHTAISAPAAVAAAVTHTALTTSPPLLLLGFASHLAALGKIQTASLCIAIIATPVAWQWHNLQSARTVLAHAENKLASERVSLAAIQRDSEQLQAESGRLDAAVSQLTQGQDRNEMARRDLDELKGRLRAFFGAADSLWPNDLPYVRVPKSAVDEITAGPDAIDPSGKMSDIAAQLLGLTPSERAFAESHLAAYFQHVSDLASRRTYETNSEWIEEGWISKSIGVPPMGRDREVLWTTYIEPVQKMLGFPRRNQFDSLWIQSVWCGAFYPWVYEDRQNSKPSPSLFTLAIKPDGTDRWPYRLLNVGHTVESGNLPIRGTLPGFLRERFEPWLESLGIYQIDTGQP